MNGNNGVSDSNLKILDEIFACDADAINLLHHEVLRAQQEVSKVSEVALEVSLNVCNHGNNMHNINSYLLACLFEQYNRTGMTCVFHYANIHYSIAITIT
jgi:hypothetical protein